MFPGLIIGNVAMESMTNSEAVKNIRKTLTKSIAKYREVDIRKKLEECQRVKVMAYQH